MTLEDRSINDHKETWTAAIQSIKAHPMYAGLNLEPQLGLIPLQQDPVSGLWEFAHLQSGEPPQIVNGNYVRTAETSIVLTLVPGGSFWMGASNRG